MPRTSSNLDILERESASQHHAIRDDFVAVGQFHRFQPNGEHGKVFARKIGGKPPKSLKYHLQYSLVYFWFTVFPTPFFGCPKKFQPNRPRRKHCHQTMERPLVPWKRFGWIKVIRDPRGGNGSRFSLTRSKFCISLDLPRRQCCRSRAWTWRSVQRHSPCVATKTGGTSTKKLCWSVHGRSAVSPIFKWPFRIRFTSSYSTDFYGIHWNARYWNKASGQPAVLGFFVQSRLLCSFLCSGRVSHHT